MSFQNQIKSAIHDEIMSLEDLLKLELPPQKWLIDGLLPIGTALLAGPPKIGKSYFVLNLMKRVVASGKGVFYYAAEDSFSRLQTRLNQLKIEGGSMYFLAGRQSTLGRDPLRRMDEIIHDHPEIDAIFLDTMHLTLPKTPKPSDYEAYVHNLKPWADFAHQRNIGVLMVHHTRKGNSEADHNPHDAILGSQGIMASFDTVMTMKRTSDGQGAVLNTTGKDIADTEYRLSKQTYGWEIEGLESLASLGDTQAKVYKFIRFNKGCLRKEIINTFKIDNSYLSRIIQKLIKENVIELIDGKHYATN